MSITPINAAINHKIGKLVKYMKDNNFTKSNHSIAVKELQTALSSSKPESAQWIIDRCVREGFLIMINNGTRCYLDVAAFQENKNRKTFIAIIAIIVVLVALLVFHHIIM